MNLVWAVGSRLAKTSTTELISMDNIVPMVFKDSPDEGEAYLESIVGKHLDITMLKGGRLFGVLEDFTISNLYLSGGRGQLIMARRSQIACLEEVPGLV